MLKSLVAKIWTIIHINNLNIWKNKSIENQEKLILKLVNQAKNTTFGKEHNFKNIYTIKDFQESVPLYDYEKIKKYIENIKQGKENVLWTKKPLYFAKTSGTTSGTKYIPLSKQAMPFHVNGIKSLLFNYIYNSKSTKFLYGKMMFLQGSPILDLENKIPTGRLSGIAAHYIPKYLQNNRLPSWETNCINDWEIKINEIIKETYNQNMTVIGGIPPWLIMYFEKLLEYTNKKKISTIFPNLELIITGGVNYEPYRSKMEQLLGKKIQILQTFPASEGFFAFQDQNESEDLLLLTNHGIFYEFIPVEEYSNENPKRLTLKNVELNKDYVLILTNNSGLWAYDIGDTVRFISKNPYKIRVSGRTKHFTSAFGEHVIVYEVESAIQDVIKEIPCIIKEFTVAPQVNPIKGLPFHEWFIEFEKEPENLISFANLLDEKMQEKNTYYKDLIKGNILKSLIINSLEKDSFNLYMKSINKLGGQNKVPRLSNDRKIADFLEKYIS